MESIGWTVQAWASSWSQDPGELETRIFPFDSPGLLAERRSILLAGWSLPPASPRTSDHADRITTD